MHETNLTRAELASAIEHIAVRPTATREDIVSACALARELGVRALSVAPSRVALAASELAGSGVVLTSVIAYPHGTGLTEAKAYEARRVMDLGAREVNMVMNISEFKSGEFSAVAHDIAGVVTPVELEGGKVKVIIETALLVNDEIETACSIARDSGAHAVMTSTGFGPSGATPETVSRIKMAVGDDMLVQASGGIRKLSHVLEMIASGADMICTSASAQIFGELKS